MFGPINVFDRFVYSIYGLQTILSEPHQALRIIINYIGDANRRHNLQKVGRQPPKKASPSFALDGFDRHINDAIVCRWMNGGPLRLQSGPQEVDWIHRTGAKGTAECSNTASGEVAEHCFFCRAAADAHVAFNSEFFEVLKCGQIDGRIGKHSCDSHQDTTVIGTNAGPLPHLSSSCCYQRIASKTA